MCCLERNSDLVVMQCYAPMLVNVSHFGRDGSMQWSRTNGYDALSSYGSSYYAAGYVQFASREQRACHGLAERTDL